MQRTYWTSWKKFLARWGLISPTYTLMGLTQPLIPLAAQMLFLGMPLFKGTAQGDAYAALLTMLGDEDALKQFADYLLEAGT